MILNGFCISEKNAKMNDIPSFSVSPVITCRTDAPCTKQCYAVHLDAYRKNTHKSWKNNFNLLIARGGYDSLKRAVNAYLMLKPVRFFRWNVGGDLFSDDYLRIIQEIAVENPNTNFLVYTKEYERINRFYPFYNGYASNLHIILSNWLSWRVENPYNLPVAEYVNPKINANTKGFVCRDNCLFCQHCYRMQKGETVLFIEHRVSKETKDAIKGI